MNSARCARVLSVVLFLAAQALPALASSFSAELVDTRRGETHTAPFQFRDKSYRFETVEKGQTLFVLHDGQSGTLRLLVPQEKTFVEAGADEPMSRFISPFAFYAYYARTGEVKTVGTETLGGVRCAKQELTGNGQLYATAWFSEDYAFPLKIEIPLMERTVEVRAIKPGPQEAALFAVPAGYQPAPKTPGSKTAERPMPNWVADIPAAPLVAAPFTQVLGEGKMLRIKTQAQKRIQLEVTNLAEANGAFVSFSCKQGRPLYDPSTELANLSKDQTVMTTYAESPEKADEVVVRVMAGTLTIQAELLGKGAGAAGQPKPAATPETTAAEPPDHAPELSAPTAVEIASRFGVLWQGPVGKDDFISVAKPDQPPGAYLSMARLKPGSPATLWAPSDAGSYEVRWVQARSPKVLTRVPIVVKDVPATLQVTGSAKVAGWIDVPWTGPSADGDSLCVVRASQPPAAYLERTLVKQGNPARVRLPGDPGTYEVRYVLGRGNRILARNSIVVEDVTATVEAPDAVNAGADFEVRWSGPAYTEDAIAVATAIQPPTANLGSRTIRGTGPLKLRAPKAPGLYEVRYVLGHGRRVLAKTVLKVDPAAAP